MSLRVTLSNSKLILRLSTLAPVGFEKKQKKQSSSSAGLVYSNRDLILHPAWEKKHRGLYLIIFHNTKKMGHYANIRKRKLVKNDLPLVHCRSQYDRSWRYDWDFYVDWDWVLFWRFFHKLEPPFPQNEMLLISKEIRMSPTVFIKSLLEANDCNFLAFEIYKHFNMLMNYNTVI